MIFPLMAYSAAFCYPRVPLAPVRIPLYLIERFSY